ncbi:MAG: type IV pili methyl-accepting chemotaxis transducer N-terminal domain-containing protein, partial [Deltaproteobacteria bacterium]|nr:type IV pili methyl-accepting chemotaxis transducer N-terminal domain-containing protein [Deltaproteobacteria bacterium]
MDVESVKTRFMGSYVFLIVLFLIQLPILYVLVGGMSKKYAQVETAAELRKRAVEINYILNRHIMNGEEELESVFQAKKEEFGRVIDDLKNGTNEISAIKDSNSLQKLEILKDRWSAMRAAMDEAMTSGDSLSTVMIEIEKTTYPMVARMNELVKGFVAMRDPSYSKSIDLAGLQRMRTVNLSYLMERYTRSNFELESVADNLKKTVSDFDATLNGLRVGSAELGLRPAGGKDMIPKFKDAEELWAKRKSLVFTGMKDKDVFYSKVKDLSNIHTPQIVAAADELTKQIANNARGAAVKGIVIMALAVILSTALAAFFMWLTNQHIIKPVIRIKETVEGFARGDLSQRAKVDIKILGKEFKDEIKDLSDSVDEMAVQVSEVIGRISDSSNHLAAAS